MRTLAIQAWRRGGFRRSFKDPRAFEGILLNASRGSRAPRLRHGQMSLHPRSLNVGLCNAVIGQRGDSIGSACFVDSGVSTGRGTGRRVFSRSAIAPVPVRDEHPPSCDPSARTPLPPVQKVTARNIGHLMTQPARKAHRASNAAMRLPITAFAARGRRAEGGWTALPNSGAYSHEHAAAVLAHGGYARLMPEQQQRRFHAQITASPRLDRPAAAPSP